MNRPDRYAGRPTSGTLDEIAGRPLELGEPATLSLREIRLLIDAYHGNLQALLVMQRHWVGHGDYLDGPNAVSAFLWQHADDCACPDESRQHLLEETADTGLTLPPGLPD